MSENVLAHIGQPRRSGRYPWGSGKNPFQRSIGWRGHVELLRVSGMSERDIARAEGISINQYRARNSISKDEIILGETAEAVRLQARGMSSRAIADRMGIPESTVRLRLNPVNAERAKITNATMTMLKDQVDQKRFIDVGKGVANQLNMSPTRLDTAVSLLTESHGYKLHSIKVPQVGIPGQFTIVKALGAPDTEWRELINDVSLVKPITAISEDFGRNFSDLGIRPIEMLDSARIQVRYGEAGKSKDGVIEIRRGVSDLDMGKSRYAQVRIGVDGTHYMKGMAIYSDNLPSGVDVIYNSARIDTGNKLDAMKPLQRTATGAIDQDNPFGASIGRQSGAINIIGSSSMPSEEGAWQEWSNVLSSQFLSKQPAALVQQQIDITVGRKRAEFEEIQALTNPVVRKQLLMAFADSADSAAGHLAAAGLPRQATKVLLPVPSLKNNEVYAPSFNDGERVVLIRYPHAGTFEIPQVVVNNKSREGRSIMGSDPADAIGINPIVARQLSGADFDGDTVLVIPNNSGKVRTSAALRSLAQFDPIESYKISEGSNIRPITPSNKQKQMGVVSNLITDMTIKGADLDEIARAVRHSMVVIDAEKHNLDYRQSARDNGIAALHAKYQGSARGGASTIISRASSPIYVDKRIPRRFSEGGPINPHTGEREFTVVAESFVNAKGETVKTQTRTTRMAETSDARILSSGQHVEEIYAGFANNLKALANSARRESLGIVPTSYSPTARQTYSAEVARLTAALNAANKNAPLERQAQMIATSIVNRKRQENPSLDTDRDALTKVRNQALAEARARTGAGKDRIVISEREWEAIQAGAISPTRLADILTNTNLDQVKQLATPRQTPLAQVNTGRARAMLAGGFTQAEVAAQLGISVSTLMEALK